MGARKQSPQAPARVIRGVKVSSNQSFVTEKLIGSNHRTLKLKTYNRPGCTPSFFEDIVKYSVDSGARILPVAKALEAIHVDLADERGTSSSSTGICSRG